MATRATFEQILLGGLKPPQPIQTYVAHALEEHTRHRPRNIIHDITGDGDEDYALPSTYVRDQSFVTRVRWVPSADFGEPAQYMTPEDWEVKLADDDTFLIHFFRHVPSSADKVIVEFNAPHVLDDTTSTIETRDESPFKALVAAYVLEDMGRAAIARRDGATDALLDPRIEEAAEFRRQGKVQRDIYNHHIGVSESDAGGQTQRAAVVISDIDSPIGTGLNRTRHTHTRRRF